ncbi:unnamed protein product, partial [Ixodes hexagonus]
EFQYLPRNFTATLDKQTCDNKTAAFRSANVRVSWYAPQKSSVRVDRYVVRMRDSLGDLDYEILKDDGPKVYHVFEGLKCGTLYIFTVHAVYEAELKSAPGKTTLVYAETPVQLATVYTDSRGDVYAPRDLKAKVVSATCRSSGWIGTASVTVSWSRPENTSVPVHSYVANAINVDDGTEDTRMIIRNGNATHQGFEDFQCGATYVITLQARYLVSYTSSITGEIGQYVVLSSPGVVNVSIGEDDEVTASVYTSTTVPTKARTTPTPARSTSQTKVTSHGTETQVENGVLKSSLGYGSPVRIEADVELSRPCFFLNFVSEPQYFPRNFTAVLGKQTCDNKTAINRSANVLVSWSAPQTKGARVDRYVVHVKEFLADSDYQIFREGGQDAYHVFEDLNCGVLYVFTVQAVYKVERKTATGKADVVYVETPVQVATVYTDTRSDVYAPRDLKAKVDSATCRKPSWIRTASVMVSWSRPENTSVPVHSYVANAVNVDDGTEDKWMIIKNGSATRQGFQDFQCGATYVITLQARYLASFTSALTGDIVNYPFVSSPGVVNVSIGEDVSVDCLATDRATSERASAVPTSTAVTQRATSPTPGHETSVQPQPTVTTTHEAVSVTTGEPTRNSTDVPEPPHKDEIKPKSSGMSTSKILMMVLIPLALIALGIAGFFAYKKAQRGRE